MEKDISNMDPFAKARHSDATKSTLAQVSSGENVASSVFFPSVTQDGQSLANQTLISHPVNIPSPSYLVPGLLTPPDTPTSPYGFLMKDHLQSRTPPIQEVTFSVSTAYDTPSRKNEPEKNIAFVPPGKYHPRRGISMSRPRLRLNTQLEVHRHEQNVQGRDFCRKIGTDSCDEMHPESYNEIKPESCDGRKPESCDGRKPESCDGMDPESYDGMEPESSDEMEHETCDGMESESCVGREPESCDRIEPMACIGMKPKYCTGMSLESCYRIEAGLCDTVTAEKSEGELSEGVEANEKLRVLYIIGSELRKIADQFGTRYGQGLARGGQVGLFSPLLTFEINNEVFEMSL